MKGISQLCLFHYLVVFVYNYFFIVYHFSSDEERAVPGGTAIPGQPVAKVEQAPDNFA